MYSLLIKDRAYPISVYLSFMMRVKGVTRHEAIQLLTHAAVALGVRDIMTPPASSTVGEWGRSIAVPMWAIISAMQILEQKGKIPYYDEEWAFWAYSTVQLGKNVSGYTGKPAEWLSVAEQYHAVYQARGAIRHRLQGVTYSNVAAKIIIFSDGNYLNEFTVPQIFFDLDSTNESIALVAEKLTNKQDFTKDDVETIINKNSMSLSLHKKIIISIHELTVIGELVSLNNGNISRPIHN